MIGSIFVAALNQQRAEKIAVEIREKLKLLHAKWIRNQPVFVSTGGVTPGTDICVVTVYLDDEQDRGENLHKIVMVCTELGTETRWQFRVQTPTGFIVDCRRKNHH